MNHQQPNGHAAMPLQAESGLRARLMQRVQRSQAHESQFHTVRLESSPWQQPQADARSRPLATTAVARSSLIELAPGATLATTPGFTQAEAVLLVGELFVGTVSLDCGDAVCAPHDSAHALRAGAAGARIYLRLSAPPQGTRTQLLRFSALIDDASWQDFCPGVRIKELWDGGERRSVLVRMHAGARVSGHGHSLEEECMMLAGEAFIGDTLLRGGEYQLAPRGSRHGAITTDVGALFYVHGSLDPAAYV
jgi:ChrR Cupin-like domain